MLGLIIMRQLLTYIGGVSVGWFVLFFSFLRVQMGQVDVGMLIKSSITAACSFSFSNDLCHIKFPILEFN